MSNVVQRISKKKIKINNSYILPPSHLGVVLLELASPGSVNFVIVKSGTYSVEPWSRSKRLPPSHLGDVLLYNKYILCFVTKKIKNKE